MKFRTRISSAILALTMLFASGSVYAADDAVLSEDTIEIIFTDVTSKRTDVLEGEAKIMVSVSGAEGIASIAQTSLKFSGNLKYKSITFLEGENNPPKCFLYSPNAALVNSKKTLMPSIISTDKSIELSGTTDLFVLTFEGEPGDTVKLTLEDPDEENTYCIIDGEQLNAAESVSITAEASDKAVKGKTATIQLTMDKVTDFAGPASTGYKNSGIELRITGEDNEGYTIYTVLNNSNISKGGHRVGSSDSSVPTFIIENTVLADDTYTVEISGIGYVPLVLENVDFDEPIELTNKDFIPGDVDGDGEVTADDMNACSEYIDAGDYYEACDFNRDEKVNKYDLAVFEGMDDDEEEEEETFTAPAKIADLKAEGGDKSVTLTWTAPENGGKDITGYTVSYGKEAGKLDSKKELDADETSVTIDGLEDAVTYYFSVCAKNEIGTSKAATANAKTNDAAEEENPAEGVPGKIAKITASDIKTSSFVLKWEAPDNGGSDITGYKIKYSTTKTKLSTASPVSVDADELEYKVSSLEDNTTYYYQIAAENAKGIGEYSEIDSAKTKALAGGGGGGGGGGGAGGGGGGGFTPPVSTPTYYTVTFDAGEGKIASGSATANVQQNAKVQSVPTVTAPEGKEFVGWTRGSDTIDPTTVAVTANITFKAVYKNKETVKPGTDTPATPSTPVEEFTDLEGYAWAKDAIYTLKTKGIINGTSATTFAPANNIKRGDFILILVRMLGITAEKTDNFADVPADSYYAEAIEIAKAAGIAKGSGENFMPEATITRQDLITLAYRAFLAKGLITETAETTPLDVFADKADVADYAVSAMSSMVKAGIITGANGKVNPKNNATRAEVAVMCSRLLGLMK